MNERRIFVFDTTLAEGELSPGCALTLDEKLRLARQLEQLGVDVIEAGFPVNSAEDFESVRLIAGMVESTGIAARCYPAAKEIDRLWEAIQSARKPRMNLLAAIAEGEPPPASGRARIRSLAEVIHGVQYAVQACPDVQVTLKDASGYPPGFLATVVPELVAAGATVLTLADTFGYALPDAYGELFRAAGSSPGWAANVVLSAHCHNDLGLALGNSLAALREGARQVECTLNGIGERVGITPLEEIVMLIASHRKTLQMTTNVRAEEMYRSCRLLGSLTGMVIQRNKPVVGSSAFAHSLADLGDVRKNNRTYERLTPESIGIRHSALILGKHTDKETLARRYQELGCAPSAAEIDRAFMLFSKAVGQKREILDEDLLTFLETSTGDADDAYHLEGIQVHSGTALRPTATVELRKGEERLVDSATGDGPVDAAYKAIERITGVTGNLVEYLIKSVGLGRDGFGEVFVRVDFGGVVFHGRGMSTDVIAGSTIAYLEALNRAMAAAKRHTVAPA